MRKINSIVITAAVALATAAPAGAQTFGVYGANQAGAITRATQSGRTAVALTNLNGASLAGINVLWVLNGSNGDEPSALVGNADVASFVQGGGVLLLNDRYVTDAASALPGGGGISFTRSFTSNINVQTALNPLVAGPGGTITDTTLDGGRYSAHGYATLGSLPAGAIGVLNNGTDGNIVDFTYAYGRGDVYYSSIPLDYYLGDGSAFDTVYVPNLLAEGAALANGNAVPEPATWAMMLVGFGLVGYALRRRARTTVRVAYA